MWPLQNKITEFWFDLMIYNFLSGKYYPIILLGEFDEYFKTMSLNGMKKTTNS